MLQFQKKNKIISNCVLNSKLLYDIFRVKFNIKVNIIVGFVIDPKFSIPRAGTHVWVEYDGCIYEPSYEWISAMTYRYTKTIDLINSSIFYTELIKPIYLKALLTDWKIHNKSVKTFQSIKPGKNSWEPWEAQEFQHIQYYDAILDYINDGDSPSI